MEVTKWVWEVFEDKMDVAGEEEKVDAGGAGTGGTRGEGSAGFAETRSMRGGGGGGGAIAGPAYGEADGAHGSCSEASSFFQVERLVVRQCA